MQSWASITLAHLWRPSSRVAPIARLVSFDCSSHKGGEEDDDIVHMEDDKSIMIPVYPDRPNEPLAITKARLMYQSRKRGMLENDLLLSTFASKFLPSLDAEQTREFDRLINKPSNDWDIYYWMTNKKPTPPEYENGIMKMLREHAANKDREERRMPDL